MISQKQECYLNGVDIGEIGRLRGLQENSPCSQCCVLGGTVTRLSHGIRKWALPASAASVPAGDEGEMIMVAVHGLHLSSYYLHPGAGA